MPPKLLLATNNKHKAIEYGRLLAGVPFELVTPAELGIATEVEETGQTFEENACLKATALAKESRLLALADDSGLEVDALGGAPGVTSARFAGENASDRDRVDYLLSKLEGVPLEKRTARFRCVICIAAPDGSVELCQGECPGIIALEPAEKNRISHRGKAAAKAREVLGRKGENGDS
jgi:XTP/dITP diphosphohydrolase